MSELEGWRAGEWVTTSCAARDAAVAAAGGRDALQVWAWDTDDRTYSHSELRADGRPVVADHRTIEQGCWHQVWAAAEPTDAAAAVPDLLGRLYDSLVDRKREHTHAKPLTDAEVDAARQRGPHRLGCPAGDRDPDGIDRCECEPVRLTDSPTIAAGLETAFGGQS